MKRYLAHPKNPATCFFQYPELTPKFMITRSGVNSLMYWNIWWWTNHRKPAHNRI